jgi:hypothetical protein
MSDIIIFGRPDSFYFIFGFWFRLKDDFFFCFIPKCQKQAMCGRPQGNES